MMCLNSCFKLNSKPPGTCTKTSPWFSFFIWKFYLEIVRAFNTFLSFLDVGLLQQKHKQAADPFMHSGNPASLQHSFNKDLYKCRKGRALNTVTRQVLCTEDKQICCPSQKYSCRNTCIYVHETT